MTPVLRYASLAICVTLCLSATMAWAQTFLVRDGQPRAEIVTAAQPTRMAELAARELQTYVRRISGAELPIVTTPSGDAPRIYVGVSRFTESRGLEVDDLEHGAFRMDSGNHWLALLGRERAYEPIDPWGRSRSSREQQRVQTRWEKITGEPFHNPFAKHFRHYYPDHDTGIFDERDRIQNSFRNVKHEQYPDLGVWTFDEAGTLNAVHAFLRSLGVRWYAPGEIGQVVPKRPHIALPSIQRIVRPDFPLRYLRYGYTQHGMGDLAAWNLRLGFNPGGDLIGHVLPCHGMKFVLEHPGMRDRHPEFYATESDGSRSDYLPCLSAEGLAEKHAAYVRAMFDHFDEPMVNIDLPDGFGMGCACDQCHSRRTPHRGRNGTNSDLVFGYLNRVAAKVYESHPDRMVGMLAYSTYRKPPRDIDTFSPNVALTWNRASKRRRLYDNPEDVRDFERRLSTWRDKLPSDEIYIWESYLSARPRTRGIPAVYPRAIARDLRSVKAQVEGEMIETYRHQTFSNFRPSAHGYDYDPFALNHLNLYITARLWWDVDRDVEALLDEYCKLYYGPAREPMRDFLDYSEAHWVGMRRDGDAIAGALKRIEAAQAAVDAGTVYARRVARVAKYIEPLYALHDQLARERPDDVLRHRVLYSRSLADKRLDGRLDDPNDWRPARTLTLRHVVTGKTPPTLIEGWARVFRAGDSLYFGIHCDEPDMQALRRRYAEHDTGAIDPERGDYVEILIETNTHSYYRIRVNPAGVVEQADMGDDREETRWRSGGQAAVYLGDDHWSVEFRLPVGGEGIRVEEPLSGVDGRMPSDAFPWYFNIGRQRVNAGHTQRSAIVGTGSEDFAVLNEFAEMWSK